MVPCMLIRVLFTRAIHVDALRVAAVSAPSTSASLFAPDELVDAANRGSYIEYASVSLSARPTQVPIRQREAEWMDETTRDLIEKHWQPIEIAIVFGFGHQSGKGSLLTTGKR